MNKKTRNVIIAGIIAVIVVIGLIIAFRVESNQPGKYDAFAQCIKQKGATFYGAFWCPHCQDQKSMFGSSVKYLPYVECSTSDGNGQLQVCQNAKINAYPTWKFTDGTVHEGEMTLQDLAKQTGCQLPK